MRLVPEVLLSGEENKQGIRLGTSQRIYATAKTDLQNPGAGAIAQAASSLAYRIRV